MSITHECDECRKYDSDKCLCERCLEKIEQEAYDQSREDYKQEIENQNA